MENDLFYNKDMRSAYVPIKRSHKARQKYLGYRSHHWTYVGQPYLAPTQQHKRLQVSPLKHTIIPWEDPTCVRTWTKRDMWLDRLNDISPLRPPHHYGRCRRCHTERPGGWRSRKEEREALGFEIKWQVESVQHDFHWCSCMICISKSNRNWTSAEEEDDLDRVEDEPDFTSDERLFVTQQEQATTGCRNNGSASSPSETVASVTQDDLAQSLGFELVEAYDAPELDSDRWSIVEDET